MEFQDYRGLNEEFSTLIPPPLPPMSIPPPFRKMLSHNDNVESIDMEMSDDDILESYEDGNLLLFVIIFFF